MVCGERLESAIKVLPEADWENWAKNGQCLFTIVNKDQAPRMVVEFCNDFGSVIDSEQLEHKRMLAPLLKALKIAYVTFSEEEFDEVVGIE